MRGWSGKSRGKPKKKNKRGRLVPGEIQDCVAVWNLITNGCVRSISNPSLILNLIFWGVFPEKRGYDVELGAEVFISGTRGMTQGSNLVLSLVTRDASTDGVSNLEFLETVQQLFSS